MYLHTYAYMYLHTYAYMYLHTYTIKITTANYCVRQAASQAVRNPTCLHTKVSKHVPPKQKHDMVPTVHTPAQKCRVACCYARSTITYTPTLIHAPTQYQNDSMRRAARTYHSKPLCGMRTGLHKDQNISNSLLDRATQGLPSHTPTLQSALTHYYQQSSAKRVGCTHHSRLLCTRTSPHKDTQYALQHMLPSIQNRFAPYGNKTKTAHTHSKTYTIHAYTSLKRTTPSKNPSLTPCPGKCTNVRPAPPSPDTAPPPPATWLQTDPATSQGCSP